MWNITAQVPARDWRWIQVEVSRPDGGAEWWTGELLFGAETRERLVAIAHEIALRVAEIERALAHPIRRHYLPESARGTPYATPDGALALGTRIAALMTAFEAAGAARDVPAGALAAQEMLDLREHEWSEAIREVPKPERRRGDSNDGFL